MEIADSTELGGQKRDYLKYYETRNCPQKELFFMKSGEKGKLEGYILSLAINWILGMLLGIQLVRLWDTR